jgi:hypothetical protein
MSGVCYARGVRISLIISLLFVGACKGNPPCDENGRCLPGFVCREDGCIPGGEPADPVGTCDATGCAIEGPDGVKLDVPADSLQQRIQITITRESDHIRVDGLQRMSGVYRLEPSDAVLSNPATLTIPLDPRLAVPAEQIEVWTTDAPGNAWTSVTSTATIELATAQITNFAYVVTARSLSSLDGGITD